MKSTALRFVHAAVGLAVFAGSAGRADEPAKTSAPKIVSREDVIYGRVHGAALTADVAWPASSEKLPAILSVHGGRWVGGHKRDASTIKVDQWAGTWASIRK